MAKSSISPVFIPISMIGPQFIASDSFEVIVDRYSTGNLVITDINHTVLLKLKPCDSSFHRQLMLLDANDRPIVMLRQKNMTAHDRWKVFRGESKAESDMIFSTKRAHMIQFKTCVEVFFANKITSNKDCDFKLKGNWSKRKCTVYVGDSSTAIAKMHAIKPTENVKFTKDKFMVTIYPNVDYAFVVALIAIVDAMKSPDTRGILAGEVAGAVGNVIGAAVTAS